MRKGGLYLPEWESALRACLVRLLPNLSDMLNTDSQPTVVSEKLRMLETH